MKSKISWMQVWAVVLLGIVAVNLLIHLFFEGGDGAEIFWYCNIATVMLAVGFLLKRADLMTAIFVTSIPVQFFWIVDFILNLFGMGMGRTAWLFDDSLFFLTPIISIALHAILVPLALWGMLKYGFDKWGYYWMGWIAFGLLPATFFLTAPELNRNCMFYPCDLNYIEDFVQITTHETYMTWRYMVQTIAQWFVVVSTTFLAFFFIFKKFDKLSK